MGWLEGYDWPTKADIIRHICEGPCLGARLKVVARAVRGSHLWTVIEQDGDYSTRFVCLWLLRKGRDNWAYKDVDESMGPCELDCPLLFLAMTPEPTSGYAVEWRQKVREQAREQAERRGLLRGAKPGDTLVLHAGCRPERLTLESIRPLRGRHDGQLFHVRLAHVSRVEPRQAALAS